MNLTYKKALKDYSTKKEKLYYDELVFRRVKYKKEGKEYLLGYKCILSPKIAIRYRFKEHIRADKKGLINPWEFFNWFKYDILFFFLGLFLVTPFVYFIVTYHSEFWYLSSTAAVLGLGLIIYAVLCFFVFHKIPWCIRCYRQFLLEKLGPKPKRKDFKNK